MKMVVAVALATMEVLDPPVLVHWQQINLVVQVVDHHLFHLKRHTVIYQVLQQVN